MAVPTEWERAFLAEEFKEHSWYPRQIQRLLQHGFPGLLGLDEAAYLAQLPQPPRQPPSYRDRCDHPLLVEPRPDLGIQHQLMGISDTNIDWHKLQQDLKNGPYIVWIRGTGLADYRNLTLPQLLASLAPDEVAGSYIELIHFHLQYPLLFGSFFAPGSADKNAVPLLSRSSISHQSEVRWLLTDPQLPNWQRPLIRGRTDLERIN